MSDHRYKCPSCGTVLKTAAAIPVGKGIKCPKCQTPFKVTTSTTLAQPAEKAAVESKQAVKARPTAPAEDEAESPKLRKGSKLPPPPKHVDEEGENEQPEKVDNEKPVRGKEGKKETKGSKKGGSPARKSSLPLILGGVVGLILVAGLVVGGLFAAGVFTKDTTVAGPPKTYPVPTQPTKPEPPPEVAGDQPLATLIVGAWKSSLNTIYEFKNDGTFVIAYSNGATQEGTYKVLDDKTIEGRQLFGGQPIVYKETFIIKGDELTHKARDQVVTKYKRTTETAGTNQPKVERIVLTPDQLSDEFYKGAGNEATLKKYAGKHLEVTGVLVEYDYESDTVLRLAGGDPKGFGYVQLKFRTSVPDVPRVVMPGQTVTLRGTCSVEIGLQWTIHKVTGDPPLTIAADQLAKDFAADQQATDAKIAKKFIIVTGEVKAVEDEGKTLVLTAPGTMPPVKCAIRYDRPKGQQAKTYKAGDKVKILGRATGGDLRLLKCEDVTAVRQ